MAGARGATGRERPDDSQLAAAWTIGFWIAAVLGLYMVLSILITDRRRDKSR